MNAATTLGNNRKALNMTEEEVKELFNRYAALKIKWTAIAAQAQKEIDVINQRCADEKKPFEAEMELIREDIERYTLVNRTKYETKRSISTPKGKIKLKLTSSVEILDEQKVIEYSDKNELTLYKNKKNIDKNAVKNYVELTQKEVPGARVISGDSVSLDVDKKLIDEATK